MITFKLIIINSKMKLLEINNITKIKNLMKKSNSHKNSYWIKNKIKI